MGMDTPAIFWAIGFPLWLFFIALGVGTVFAMSDSESIGFLVSKLCFIGAAATFIGFSVYWIVTARLALSLAIVLAALIGIVSIPSLILALAWVRTTEIRLSSRLVPADLPDPSQWPGIPANALKVFIGSNVAWATTMPHTVLMMNGDPMIAIDRDKSDRGLVVSILKIFDDRDNIIARIDEDGFWVENSTRKKRPDPSTLVVYDHTDTEVLRIVLLNEKALLITGVFRHAGIDGPIIITPTFMKIGGTTLTRNSFGESGLADIAVGSFPQNAR